MSEIDKLKAKIAFLEKLFFGSLAILVALTGWGAANYNEASEVMMFAAAAAMLLFVGVCVHSYLQINKLIEELGDV